MSQNRLAREKSPYLLQHADQPIDWYPWCQEAFDRATAEDKPVFLSIGYATCHWCHVMAREAFSDQEVAKMMNETFINIKVDREEHPDVDNLYMEFAQALFHSSLGWPLNVILTPDKKPFYAATYLPVELKEGMMGIKELIASIQQIWNSDEREEVISQSDQLTKVFQSSVLVKGEVLLSEEEVEAAFDFFFKELDAIYGGVQGPPKFPMAFHLQTLMSYAKKSQESRALYYIELTLDRMVRGGIYDQLEGGVSRYSVDEMWHIPHFEKMLYDNALFASAYCDGWKLTKNSDNLQIAEETLDYVLAHLTRPEGGFYSAQDADTEGQEGHYYLFVCEEIEAVLPPQDVPLFCEYYGVTYEGNFEGKNVLHRPLSLHEFCDLKKLDPDDFVERMKTCRAILLKHRQKRTQPFKDDKILTSWNGLMIDAMLRVGKQAHREEFIQAAKQSLQFIRKEMWNQGKLRRRYRDGKADFLGTLDDYAFLIRALITSFEIYGKLEDLEWAVGLTNLVDGNFKESSGAFYLTEAGEDLLLRRCELYDGALPCGNAVHAENLIRLYQLTRDGTFMRQAEDILKAAKPIIERNPAGAAYLLKSMQWFLDENAPTFVIALDEKESLREDIEKLLANAFLPHASIIWKREGDPKLVGFIPFLEEYRTVDGQTALYLCTREQCFEPVIHLREIEELIKKW